MFLTSEAGDFLIIAIIAVFIIAFSLVIYLLITTKKKDNGVVSSNEYENNRDLSVENIEVTNSKMSDDSNEFEFTQPQKFNNFNLIEEAEKRIDNSNIEIQEEESQDDRELKSSISDEKKEDTNIESVLNQMQKDLESLEKNEAEIARYEEEEEKNAIISYKELMKYKDVKDKDIILEDKNKEEIKEIIESNPHSIKKFKRSEFISPIFGYNDDSNVTYREIKRPPRKEKIKDSEEWEADRILKKLEDSNTEIMEFEEKKDNIDNNTTRFLDELVDFRKKLD